MASAPRVRVQPGAIARRGRGWRVTWALRNEGPSALSVREAWHPHARFRGSRVRRVVRIAAGRTGTLGVPARTDVQSGERIENCFLILRVTAARRAWRILARFTVTGGAGGAPSLRVEAVDVHAAEG